jgi:beta-aspartyl-peptidase (threonine type)
MQFAGQKLKEAADAVIMDELMVAGGDGGIVAVDASGEVSMVFNTPGHVSGER